MTSSVLYLIGLLFRLCLLNSVADLEVVVIDLVTGVMV